MFDLECSTRKPYEVLLFAQRPGAVAVPAKTILAVPDLHSRKPCVKGLSPTLSLSCLGRCCGLTGFDYSACGAVSSGVV